MIELKFHHIGVITENLELTMKFYESLGYLPSKRTHEPAQKAVVAVMLRESHPMIELVNPESDSPAMKWIRAIKVGPYHTCYQVNELKSAVEYFWERQLAPVSDSAESITFGGAQVLFLWGQSSGLVELLEPVSTLQFKK